METSLDLKFFEYTPGPVAKGFITTTFLIFFESFHAREDEIKVLPTSVSVPTTNIPLVNPYRPCVNTLPNYRHIFHKDIVSNLEL